MNEKNKYGICLLSQIPMRSTPSEKSEMVSQLLFGEVFEIVENEHNWLKINSYNDNYYGWINKTSILSISDDLFQNIVSSKQIAVASLTANISTNFGDILITQGSSLPMFKNGVGEVGEFQYSLVKGSIEPIDVCECAKQYLGAPYLWGGRTFMGIDCSGFIMNLFKQVGIKLPRDASKQVEVGEVVNFLEETKPGDLCFFDNDEGEIIHVGMLLDKSHVIHSSGRVRIDKIDHTGIYNEGIGDYSHKLRIIKQILK